MKIHYPHRHRYPLPPECFDSDEDYYEYRDHDRTFDTDLDDYPPAPEVVLEQDCDYWQRVMKWH